MTQTPSLTSDSLKKLDFSERIPPAMSAEELSIREQQLRDLEMRREMQERYTRWQEFIRARGSRYALARLDSFEAQTDLQRGVVADLTWYAKTISARIREGNGVFAFGPRGTGKDHLLVALTREAFRRGHRVTWRNGMDLFGDVRDLMDSHESEREFVRELVGAEVLYISDPIPGDIALTDFQQSMLFRIIDGRYNHMRPTWMSCNVMAKQDAESRLGPHVWDRILDGSLACFCNWQSHRQKLTPTGATHE